MLFADQVYDFLKEKLATIEWETIGKDTSLHDLCMYFMLVGGQEKVQELLIGTKLIDILDNQTV